MHGVKLNVKRKTGSNVKFLKEMESGEYSDRYFTGCNIKNIIITTTEIIERSAILDISLSTSVLKQNQAIESIELNNSDTKNLRIRSLLEKEVTTLTSAIKFIITMIIIDIINNKQITDAFLRPKKSEEAAKKSFSGCKLIKLKKR